MGAGAIRFEPDGFPEVPDRLVHLASLAQGGAQVVVGLGVIRFQADCFLELAWIFPPRRIGLWGMLALCEVNLAQAGIVRC